MVGEINGPIKKGGSVWYSEWKDLRDLYTNSKSFMGTTLSAGSSTLNTP